MTDDRHLCAFRPDLQLISCRRAEGIRRCQHDAVAGVLKAHGQLADGRRLAHAVHADHQHHHRPLERLARHAHDLLENLLENLARFLRVGDLFFFHARFQLLNDLIAGAHAHIAHNQNIDQIFIKVVVDLLGRLDQLVHAPSHISTRFGKALPQAAEKPLLFFFLLRLLRRLDGLLFRPDRLFSLLLLFFFLLFTESKESHTILLFDSFKCCSLAQIVSIAKRFAFRSETCFSPCIGLRWATAHTRLGISSPKPFFAAVLTEKRDHSIASALTSFSSTLSILETPFSSIATP